MNRLIIIGNGFDMAHGLNTSYKDFINWYWDQIRDHCLTSNDSIYEDSLLKISLTNTKVDSHWFGLFTTHFRFREYVNTNGDLHQEWKYSGLVIFNYLEDQGICTIEKSPLFDRISKSIETKGWVDIENDYYSILKSAIGKPDYENEVIELNKQLKFIQDKLVEYLSSLPRCSCNANITSNILSEFDDKDFSTKDSSRAKESIESCYQEAIKNHELGAQYRKFRPKRTLLLSFNYTNTSDLYKCAYVEDEILIHGNLNNPKDIIFGYGDELDKDFKDIVDRNENELLKNVKSVKYLETDNYKKMLNFIESEPFQVFIMGHSCGNSDRTLLNTIFEHKNCVSIKPFYYRKPDGSDNYLELVQNIYRNFTDLKLYRDRVVNKTQCQTM